MKLGDQFADAAVSSVGIPFVDCGRDENGVDCAGLVIHCARTVGYEVLGDWSYVLGHHADLWQELTSAIAEHADLVQGEWERGDILVLRQGQMYAHCGIFVGRGQMVHAWARRRGFERVVLTSLDGALRASVRAAYRLREMK